MYAGEIIIFDVYPRDWYEKGLRGEFKCIMVGFGREDKVLEVLDRYTELLRKNIIIDFDKVRELLKKYGKSTKSLDLIFTVGAALNGIHFDSYYLNGFFVGVFSNRGELSEEEKERLVLESYERVRKKVLEAVRGSHESEAR